MGDTLGTTLIVKLPEIIVATAALIGALTAAFVSVRSQIVKIVEHTNSMKDALVEVTGDKRFAEGYKLGESIPSPAEHALRDRVEKLEALVLQLAANKGIHGEVGPTGATGETGPQGEPGRRGKPGV